MPKPLGQHSGSKPFCNPVRARTAESKNLEMTPVKAALLSFAMLSAIIFCGVGIYAADASSGHAVLDGYGVMAAH